MIIVEGMDNSGKSTLCDRLSREFLLPVVRRSGPYKDFSEWEYAITLDIDQTLPIIRDRVPAISELIYGRTLRGDSIAGEDHLDFLERFLNKKHMVLIYCRPPENEINNWGDREQMEGVIENNEKLIEAYDNFFRVLEDHLHIKVYHYDFTSHDHYERLLVEIENQVRDMIESHSTFQRLSTFNFLENYNER